MYMYVCMYGVVKKVLTDPAVLNWLQNPVFMKRYSLPPAASFFNTVRSRSIASQLS